MTFSVPGYFSRDTIEKMSNEYWTVLNYKLTAFLSNGYKEVSVFKIAYHESSWVSGPVLEAAYIHQGFTKKPKKMAFNFNEKDDWEEIEKTIYRSEVLEWK